MSVGPSHSPQRRRLMLLNPHLHLRYSELDLRIASRSELLGNKAKFTRVSVCPSDRHVEKVRQLPHIHELACHFHVPQSSCTSHRQRRASAQQGPQQARLSSTFPTQVLAPPVNAWDSANRRSPRDTTKDPDDSRFGEPGVFGYVSPCTLTLMRVRSVEGGRSRRSVQGAQICSQQLQSTDFDDRFPGVLYVDIARKVRPVHTALFSSAVSDRAIAPGLLARETRKRLVRASSSGRINRRELPAVV